jgi:hypothetical protein
MSTSDLYRRISRREMHSPKSVLAIVLAVIVILACAYAGTEIVLDMLGARPLLAAPADMASALSSAASVLPVYLIVAGAIVLLLGIITVVAALRSSRRPRHLLDSDRTAIVVDDAVIASALARHASAAAGVDPDSTVVTVGRGAATVRLTPASGIPVDRDAVRRTVDEQLDQYSARPRLRGKVVIGKNGKVGA